MRTRSTAGIAAVAALALVLAGCVPEPRPVPSPSPTRTASVDESGPGPGDRRKVTEPTVPATTCATLTARLSMPNGTADADDEENPPDTARLQRALNGCAQDGDDVVAVRLAASGTADSFLSGPVTLPAGVVLLLDPDVVLYASRNPSDYQADGGPTCGTVGGNGKGCVGFVSVSAPNAGIQSVTSSDGRQGRIDGRGDAQMIGSDKTWWDIAADARDGGFQNVPRLIDADGADNFSLHDIDLADSAGYHVYYADGDGFTAWGVRIRTPATARNTDGLDVDGATNVTITNSWISAGDDGVGIKASSEPTAHVTVTGNHLYGTHGISVGALTTGGVSDVVVDGNTISGVDAFGTLSASPVGIRIKSSSRFGGTVQQVAFRNTCIDAVQRPIDIDPRYFDLTGSTTPWFTDISIDTLTATNSPSGARSRLNGLDDDNPLGVTMSNVTVDAPRVESSHATITANGVTFGGQPLAVTGDGVRLSATSGAPSSSTPSTCAFPPFPSG